MQHWYPLCHRKAAKESFSLDGWKTGLHLALLGTIACTELQIQRSFGADACMSFPLGNQRVVLHWVEITGPNFGIGIIAAARLELAFVQVGNLPRLRPDRRIYALAEKVFWYFRLFAFMPRLPQAITYWRDKCTCACIPSRRPVMYSVKLRS